ncbi:unnamed protein product, partial [Musa acuminata var. zebrina]
ARGGGHLFGSAGESGTDERFDQIRLVALESGQLVGPRARRGPLLCHWAPMLGRKDRHALLHRVVFPLSPSFDTFYDLIALDRGRGWTS